MLSWKRKTAKRTEFHIYKASEKMKPTNFGTILIKGWQDTKAARQANDWLFLSYLLDPRPWTGRFSARHSEASSSVHRSLDAPPITRTQVRQKIHQVVTCIRKEWKMQPSELHKKIWPDIDSTTDTHLHLFRLFFVGVIRFCKHRFPADAHLAAISIWRNVFIIGLCWDERSPR